MTPAQLNKLLAAARKARALAYAPYSKFRVGAAILTDNNKLYTGSNVENASYGGTVCAERTAIWKAVTEGAQRVKAVVVVAESKGGVVPPCGLCLQVMSEFLSPDAEVWLASPKRVEARYRFSELLPVTFSGAHLSGKPL